MHARRTERSLDKWGGKREILSLDLKGEEWVKTAQEGR